MHYGAPGFYSDIFKGIFFTILFQKLQKCVQFYAYNFENCPFRRILRIDLGSALVIGRIMT